MGMWKKQAMTQKRKRIPFRDSGKFRTFAFEKVDRSNIIYLDSYRIENTRH